MIEGVGVVRRWAARVIDNILLLVTIYSIGFAFFVFLDKFYSNNDLMQQVLNSFERLNHWLDRFVTVSMFIIFSTICEGMNGSTPGKRILGITVLREDLKPCAWDAALVRNVLFLVDTI